MAYSTPRKTPFFFREENTNLIVKGNFMTLAAKPEHVEKGEWLAHQGNSNPSAPNLALYMITLSR